MVQLTFVLEDVTSEQLEAIKKILNGKATKVKAEPLDEEEDEAEEEEEEKPAKKKAGKKPVKKEEVEEEEEEDEETEEEEEEDDETGYTVERVREKCQQLIQGGQAAKLKALLAEFGAAKVVNLKAKDFEKFMTKANKIKITK